MHQMAATFETGAATHTGKVRSLNEDRFLARPQAGLWAVADGMGGHEGGEIASAALMTALETIGAPASAPDLLARLEDRVLRANRQLREMSRARGGVLGTTLAALLVFDRDQACVWSGDSRIYRVRDGSIAQLTRDHSEAQEMVDLGLLTADEARVWPRRNVITRAIGVSDEPELEIHQGRVAPGDIFVLCSDGLTAHVADEEILAHVAGAPPQVACDDLIALTLERGASDNVTVVAVRCMPGPRAGG
ncbi:serine/threonine protein phosphatase [Chelatococcus daeguensis]|uniref:Serine/threonine protein phosphatase n=2 Tax=Chelatococcus daeguensis TaxID=444444 RepID=A0AAC9JRL4_9HYPH|nr:serine/threonine protein phosphatase [Chelatococcus daeguensis]